MTDRKLPPQDLEAEEAVLGAMMLSKDAVSASLELLSETDFYQPKFQVIFCAVRSLERSGSPVDLRTVTDYLQNNKMLEGAGGAAFITDLISRVPNYSNIEAYAKIVKAKSILRQLIQTGQEITNLAFEGGGGAEFNLDQLIDQAEQKLYLVSHNRNIKDFQPIDDLVTKAFDMLEKVYKNKDHITGLPSGFYDLDSLTAGFQPADLIIVAGRPSMGKTALTLNIAAHVAFEHKKPVAVFNLEMPATQLVQRILSQEAEIDQSLLRKGMIKQSDWGKLHLAASRIAKGKIFIDDTANITVLEIRAKSRKLKSQNPDLSLIIVDYLQLISSSSSVESRQQQITEISRGMKLLSRELNVPIIVLSQLNRAVESRTDRRPMLSDLRESGSIEQDADLVMLLYRDEYYKKDKTAEPGIAEISIAKHRNGPIGVVKLEFKDKYTRFYNTTRRSE
ncbi:MAG: replicative DNA helicase [Candidatus Wallbacteria bacterium]|nr:replicative DNA helicase [Candidatus Wallbacteria bacterium]